MKIGLGFFKQNQDFFFGSTSILTLKPEKIFYFLFFSCRCCLSCSAGNVIDRPAQIPDLNQIENLEELD